MSLSFGYPFFNRFFTLEDSKLCSLNHYSVFAHLIKAYIEPIDFINKGFFCACAIDCSSLLRCLLRIVFVILLGKCR